MASETYSETYVDIPLACSLTAAELKDRGEEIDVLFARAHTLRELPDGYGFAFPGGDETAQDIVQFIVAERACCPFFTFEMTFPSPHASVWLFIRGREGVKDIVRNVVDKLTLQVGA
jgi:hypothetical protein